MKLIIFLFSCSAFAASKEVDWHLIFAQSLSLTGILTVLFFSSKKAVLKYLKDKKENYLSYFKDAKEQNLLQENQKNEFERKIKDLDEKTNETKAKKEANLKVSKLEEQTKEKIKSMDEFFEQFSNQQKKLIYESLRNQLIDQTIEKSPKEAKNKSLISSSFWSQP